jgi:hypothetical protein
MKDPMRSRGRASHMTAPALEIDQFADLIAPDTDRQGATASGKAPLGTGADRLWALPGTRDHLKGASRASPEQVQTDHRDDADHDQ